MKTFDKVLMARVLREYIWKSTPDDNALEGVR